MSEELSYKVEVAGVQDLDKLANTIEKVNNVLRAGAGSGKSLEEMRKILVGMKGQASIIEQLRDAVVGLKSSTAGLNKVFIGEITSLKGSLINELRAIQGVISTNGVAAGAAFNDSISEGMASSKKKVDAQADATVEAIKKAQKQVAAATNTANAVYQKYNPSSGLKGLEVLPQNLSVGQSRLTLDEARRMIGLPSRSDMQTFAGQIQAQMEEAFKQTPKGRSSTPVSLDDTRAMLGLPDRASMSTFAAQIKAQMNEELAKAKLRTSSATPMTLEDTRAMLGMPDRAGMSTFASQLKAQMNEELAKAKLRGASATPMGLEGTRAMLGLPDRAAMSTFASQIKAQMNEELNKVKLRNQSATPMSLADTRALLGLPSESQMETLAAQIKSQMRAAVRLDKAKQTGSGLGIDVSTIGGEFSPFDSVKRQTQATKSALLELGAVSPFEKMIPNVKRLNADLGDTHSLARGLASGFDLLWLTWGKLAPLFTGAAISFGVRKTFDIGAEVEYNLKMMEMLGQSTKEQAPIIRQALRDIDQTTQFSLTELSQNLVVLGQAGLTTRQSLQMLRPAADLASLGQVSLKTSTDLLIQSMALFGKTSKDSGVIAAQIFEATKTGVLNVEDIAGSLKYASEVNTRFGKSLSETLTILNALAQGGIKASSGGTAFINFLRDLNGRTAKSTKALADLSKQTGVTLEAFNEDGSQKPVIDLIGQLMEATKKLNPKDVDKFLQGFFTARGGRTWYTAIREGTVNLAELQKQIENASPEGFMKNAQGLMDTSRGAMDVLKGTMVGALDTAFEKYSDGFKKAITDATAFIGSSEFQGSINSLIGGVMSLYESLRTLWPVIELTAKAFVVFKAATAGMAVFQTLAGGVAALGARFLGLQTILSTTGGVTTALTGAMTANGTAMIAQQAAANAAAVGQTPLQAALVRTNALAAAGTGILRGFAAVASFLANPLVGVAVSLGLVASVFYTTSAAAKEHSATFSDAVVVNGKISIDQWDKEIAKLRERNSVMASGNAMSRYSEQRALIDRKALEVDQARKAMEVSQKLRDDTERTRPGHMLGPLQNAAVTRDTAAYFKQLKEQEKMKADVQAVIDKEAKDEADAVAKAAKKYKDAAEGAMGDPKIPPIEGGSGGGKGGKTQYEKYFDAEEARIKNANEYAKAMWQEMYSQGQMSATEYYDNLILMANREADSQIEAMRRQIAAGKDVEQANVAIEKAEQDRTVKSVQLNNQRVAALSREEYSLEAIQARLEAMQREGERAADVDIFGIGHGSKEAGRLKQLAEIAKKYDDERTKVATNLAKRKDSKTYAKDVEEAKKATEEINAAEAKRVETAKAGWKILDAEQGNWLRGANKAWEEYAAQVADKATTVNGIMGSMFKGMEDMLTNFVMTGKLEFKSFALSVIQSLIRMEAQAATSSIFSLLGKSMGGLGGALSSLGSMIFNAKGNVYNSPSLSSFSNGVYSTPQMFAFAKGAGIFGEAGPEAIMPLTRTSGGDLGVKMTGGGAGGAPTINVETNVYVDGNGNAKSSTTVQGSESAFGNMAKELSNLNRQQIEKETRQGGIIWRAINGYN